MDARKKDVQMPGAGIGTSRKTSGQSHAMTSKHINFTAGVLFVLSQVLLFLGLDSEKGPNTVAFCTVAMICLAASVVGWIFGLRRAAREKRQGDSEV